MSLTRSVIGYAILIGAIVCVAFLIHLEPSWILGISALLVGLGIVGSFENTHQGDPH